MKKPSAFSLIELSIVVLIIGILIAGVTQSTIMVKQAKLRTARAVTQSSPVSGINNLMLWYETSLESSFESTEQSDGSTITTWYDNNKQSSVKNNATQSTSGYKPLFKEYVLNGGIPTIRFDGSDDYLSFSGTDLVGTNYTVFVVEQRRAAIGYYFFGGSGTTNLSNLFLGYSSNVNIMLGHTQGANNLTATSAVAAYLSPIPRIHTGLFSSTSGSGKQYWLNGGSASADFSSTTQTSALTSYIGAALGRRTDGSSNTFYFNGDLAEIIIYTRALSTEERQSIETYLGKKYAVTIS